MKHLTLPIAAVLLVSPIVSQANDADTTTINRLDEVVVVSTPKEHTSLRQQPLTSTSLGAASLRYKGIDGIKDLTAHIPGLFIPDYGSRLTSSIYLRGIGSRIGTAAVGMYVDGIPMTSMSSMDLDLSDADRIDILRGPQGTLYGRNTMGGLIRVYTKNPMQYQGTDIQLSGAMYNDYRARISHYQRPSDKLAFSFGLGYQHQGGFFTNEALDKRADAGDDLSARWRGIYLPSERVKIDLSTHYQMTMQGAYPYVATEGEDAGQVAYNRDASYKRHLLNLGLNAEHRFNRMSLTSTTGFQFLKDDMLMDQDFSRKDIYTLNQRQNSKTLSEEVAMKSSSNRHWRWTQGAQVQYQWLQTQGPVTFYQDGLDWLSSMANSQANTHMPVIQSGPMQMAFNFQDQMEALDGAKTQTGVPFATDFSSPVLTTGIFHESTFPDIFGVKGLSLSAGLRLDYERIWLEYDAGYAMNHTYELSGHLTGPMDKVIPMVPARQFSISGDMEGSLSNDYLQLLPRFSLQYEWGPTGNVYATVSRGYRSGGYNIQMFNELLQSTMRTSIMQDVANATIPVMEAQPMVPADKKEQIKDILNGMARSNEPDVDNLVRYKPESAWNYEIGTHLNLFDGRIKADLAAYWIETSNLQLSQMSATGMGRVTDNAGSSRSLGCEVGLQAVITEALTGTATYGYTHAKAKNGDEEFWVPFVPQHTMSVGGRYVWNTRGFLQHLVFSANVKANGRTYWTQSTDFQQPFYALLDARLSVVHDNLELGLWGKNLTQSHYDAFFFITRSQGFAQRGKPLQVGVDLKMKF